MPAIRAQFVAGRRAVANFRARTVQVKANPTDYGASRRSSGAREAARRSSRSPAARPVYSPPASSRSYKAPPSYSSQSSYGAPAKANPTDYGAARRSSSSRESARRSSRSPAAREAYSPPQLRSYESNSSYSSSASSYGAPAKANPIDYGAARRSTHTVNPAHRMSAAQRAARSPTARSYSASPSSYVSSPSSSSSYSSSSSSYGSPAKANPVDYGAARRSSSARESARRSSHSPAPRESSAPRSYSASPPAPASRGSRDSSPSYGGASSKSDPTDYGDARRSKHSINVTQRNSAAQRAARRAAVIKNSSSW